ncbi:hypothetical protein F5Y08DRAFT_341691 [Xylaria arbuscula]|nr:hypothetical protein F5Y08DRAFT_341691 [Xylaria arbuscula]
MAPAKPNQNQVTNQRRRKCLKGGCPLMVRSIFCSDHQKEQNAYRKAQREKCKAESKCYRCGSEILETEDRSFYNCAKCRQNDRECYKNKQAAHRTDQQIAQPELVPRGQRKAGATDDPDKKPCHWSGCAVIVGPNGSMCAAHVVEHAQYQAARRKMRKNELKCGRCSSALDDPRFADCTKCRHKKAQYTRNKREKSNMQRQNIGAEDVPRGQKSFVELVCNPESNEDVEVAEILLQMSKSLLIVNS